MQSGSPKKVTWAGSEMLDLGEVNVVEKLDKKLAGDVSLVAGESFNGDEDGR